MPVSVHRRFAQHVIPLACGSGGRRAFSYKRWMLDLALRFVAQQVNAHLLKRTGSALGPVAVGPVVDDTGKWVVAPNTVQLTLVHLEQEPSFRNAPQERVQVGSALVLQPPPMKLNAVVLFAASFASYEQALRQLSLVLGFFHARPVFDAAEQPGLPPGVERLAVELVGYGPEQLNQLWSTLGAKHLPSVVYRLRMVVLADEAEPAVAGPPITTVQAELLHR